MGRYIEWDDVIHRYANAERSGGASEVGSAFIAYAEAELDGMMTGFYSVPFSSNNLTAKDLSIDLTYLRIATFKDKQRKQFKDEIDKRINDLRVGNSSMLTTSGDVLNSVGEVAYSNTMNYEPVFGMGNVEDFHVDSGQLYDEEQARD